MLLFSPRWLFFIPGITLFSVSLFSYGALLFGPVSFGGIRFDVHTLFFAGAGMVLGFLSAALGIVIRLFGIREGLLREHFVLEKLRSSPVLELGGSFGIIIFLGGLISGILALNEWGSAGFGDLEPGALLRQISFAIVFMHLGGITLMTSLIIGFLALPTRDELG
jgi:hypothetical protein